MEEIKVNAFTGRYGKRLLLVAAASFALAGLVSCAKQQPIKIGVLVPLTGTGSVLVDLKDGLTLAVDELNARGGINGRKLQLIVEDDHSNAEEAVADFGKLEASAHPLFFVSALSYLTVPLAPLAAKANVVLFALAVASPEITVGNDWVFRFYSGAAEEASAAATIIQNLGVKRLGILYINDSYGKPVYDLTTQLLPATRDSTIAIPFDVQTTDFHAQIGTLMDTSAIYVIALAANYPTILSQLREMSYRGKIICGSGAALPSTIQMDPTQGVYVAAPVIFNPSYLFAREAKARFEGRFSKPFSQYSANGYDLIKMVGGLLENEKVTRSSLKALLGKGLMYSGTFGSLVLRPGEQSIPFALYPTQVVDKSLKYQ